MVGLTGIASGVVEDEEESVSIAMDCGGGGGGGARRLGGGGGG